MITDQTDYEERPWEEPGEIRRDAEPHRGLPLCCAAICSLLCVLGGALLFFVLFIRHNALAAVAFILIYGSGFALTIWTWLAARKDLRKMQRNEMTIHGEVPTLIACDLAKTALVISLLVLLFCLGILFLS